MVQTDGLQLDEHRQFQEKFWRIQRFAWVSFLFFIVLAILGLTGDGGIFSRASAILPGATVDYPRIARWETSDLIIVRFDAGGGQHTLLFSPEFAWNFEIEDIQPSPKRSEATADGNLMIFRSSGGQPLSVKFETRPRTRGLTTYRVAVDGGAFALIDTLILP